LALCAAAAALFVAACGDGGGDEENGPASLVPATAPAYFEVVLRPEGEAADDAEAALGKIIDSPDPGNELVTQLEQSAARSGEGFNYEEEIAPWLGERVGIFPSSLAGESEAALVIETTDPDKALEFVSSQEDATDKEGEYEGHTFKLDADGDAFGIVDDFLVFAKPAGFKQVVDTADGDSLADEDDFKDSVGDLPEDRLATLYALPKTFLEAIPDEEIDPQGRAIVLKALGEGGSEPILGDITATAENITLDFSAGGGAVETNESALLGELPADSWLAFGLSDIGAAVQNSVDQIESAGVPGLDGEAIREQLRSQAGINLEQDVINTLGDAALFVQGTSISSLGGALVIETKDPAASAGLLTKLQTLIAQQAGAAVTIEPLASTSGDQGFRISDPANKKQQPVSVIQRDDRIIVGYGGAAINQALTGTGAEGSGAQPLSKSPTFTGAKSALGDLGIDLFVSFAPIFQLAETQGATADPDYQQAKPYLDSLDFIASGSGTDGDRSSVRLVIGLK
jgi:hypothetical protein